MRVKLVDYLYDDHCEGIDIRLRGRIHPFLHLGCDLAQQLWRRPTYRAPAGGSRATDRVNVLCYRGKTEVRETGVSLCTDDNVALQEYEPSVSLNELESWYGK